MPTWLGGMLVTSDPSSARLVTAPLTPAAPPAAMAPSAPPAPPPSQAGVARTPAPPLPVQQLLRPQSVTMGPQAAPNPGALRAPEPVPADLGAISNRAAGLEQGVPGTVPPPLLPVQPQSAFSPPIQSQP